MHPNSSFDFFAKRRFLPLFCTQFLGAFNDNLLKTAIIVLVSYHGLSISGLGGGQLVNLAGGIFILPYFLFSATAGKVSERFDKAHIARLVKTAEILIMLLAGAGFFLHSGALLMSALFCMGAHSTFFGPLKYSVLPQYLDRHELVGGNGLIEMGTFLAILIGQVGGVALTQGGPWAMAGFMLLTAVLGRLASGRMPPAPPTAPSLKLSFNIAADSLQLLRAMWRLAEVRSAILGISWFWLIGAIYTTQLPVFTREHLGGDESVYTLALFLFSVGIGAGSMLCAKLSRGELELGLVAVGALGMTAFGCDLGLGALRPHQGELIGVGAFVADPAHWRAIADIALLGVFGGFFTVPLYTWLQTASPAEFRSQAIAANNIVNGLFMVVATVLIAIGLKTFNSVALLFALTALANIAALLVLLLVSPALSAASANWWRRRGWRRG